MVRWLKECRDVEMIEDGRISNAERWQLMVDVEEAVCFRKDETELCCFQFCLWKRDSCASTCAKSPSSSVSLCPCRTNKKGKRLGQLLSLLMGDARPFVRS
jgi:hypothetical protein